MITKTEVLKAIADSEKFAGWGPLDQGLAIGVQKGALHVLIEAAKCAKYNKTFNGSDSYLFLDDRVPQEPVRIGDE